MDINYFLLLRGKYNTILNQINYIIENLDDICELDAEKLLNNNFDSEQNKDFFIDRKNNFLYLRDLCTQYIQNLCNHEFETDTIDINPDESRTISYCTFCDKTNPLY